MKALLAEERHFALPSVIVASSMLLMHDVLVVSCGIFLTWTSAMFVAQCLPFEDCSQFRIFRCELQKMHRGKPEIRIARYDSESKVEGETELKFAKTNKCTCVLCWVCHAQKSFNNLSSCEAIDSLIDQIIGRLTNWNIFQTIG